ncbi:retrovirus-related pol polyprotein from transposon TNT 1-94 [Tanacetum coccineum]
MEFLKKEVYVGQPLGFASKQYLDHVYALDKALYGLKQAPRAWYDVLSKFLIDSSFQKGLIDTTLFIKKKGKHIMLIQIYVDDIIFGSTNPKYCTKFSELMVKRFEMSMMGEMKFFLGLQVNQFSNGIFINQSKYILDILKRFGMENCDTVPTPMVEQAKLKLDLVGKPVDHTDYRSMIGSLMYLTSSRPDIMFATCMCARYQANPNEHHVSAVKRIFRYLKGTINLGLWYPKDSGFDLTAYSDADHAGCHLDRKSTSGSVQFLGDKLVCWSSKKQNCVSISTAESEYVAVSGCCAQVLWMRTQLTDYGFFFDKVPIYCDSKSAIAISCNPVQHTRTKHIDVRYHFIKDHVEKGTIELYFVGTEFQLADLFTKSLPEARFKFLVEKLGNSQVKDNKTDLLVQQYKQFTILEEESIDNGFARFNTIITSLKALDEDFSSNNYVRKFFRAIHPKWRAKVTEIEEFERLVITSSRRAYRVKSIALKAKKESSNDETLTSGSDDKEYAMAMGDPNHLIGDCPKPSRNKDQKAFIGGSWSDNENYTEDKTNDKTCLKAQSSNEVTLNSSYYSDNASSLDNDNMQIEYDSLCEISLKIINKNKILKTKRDLLEKEILGLNEKIKKLERSKEIEIACKSCEELKSENAKLKETQVKFVKFDKSANSLVKCYIHQKSPSCKIGLGFDDSKASTSGTKNMSFVGSSAEKETYGSTIKVHGSTLSGSVSRTYGKKGT